MVETHIYNGIVPVYDTESNGQMVPVDPSRDPYAPVWLPDYYNTVMSYRDLEKQAKKDKAQVVITGYLYHGRVLVPGMTEYNELVERLNESITILNTVQTVEVERVEYRRDWWFSIKAAIATALVFNILLWLNIFLAKAAGG